MRNTVLCILCACASMSATVAQPAFTNGPTLNPGLEPSAVASGDFNGDGLTDLAVPRDTPDGIAIFLGAGGGTFTAGPIIALGNGVSAQDIEAQDFDGDGDLDLAVSQQNSNTVRIVLNTGGSFSLGASVSVGSEPRHLVAEDFDGDGDFDIASSNRNGNSVSILINAGSGIFSNSQTIAAGLEPRDLAVADIDGDGDWDLAVTAHDSRQVILLTNTAGTFSTGPILSTGGNLRPEGVASADFDNDGDTDIAASVNGLGMNAVAIYINNAGTFAPFVTYPTGGIEPSSLRAGDFDADGNVDLVVANEDSANLAVLPNIGIASFGAPIILSAGANPSGLRVADLDGNGSLDIASANEDSNSVTLYFNTQGGMPPAGMPTLTLLNNANIGTTATLRLSSPSDPGAGYICGFSLSTLPGILLSDNRRIPLTVDTLFLFTLNVGNGLAANNIGAFNAQGTANATISIPQDPSLIGASFFSAFAVGDASNPTGIGTISPSLLITIQ